MSLVLDDSLKTKYRSQGLSRNYQHSLLAVVNKKPAKSPQDMPPGNSTRRTLDVKKPAKDVQEEIEKGTESKPIATKSKNAPKKEKGTVKAKPQPVDSDDDSTFKAPGSPPEDITAPPIDSDDEIPTLKTHTLSDTDESPARNRADIKRTVFTSGKGNGSKSVNTSAKTTEVATRQSARTAPEKTGEKRKIQEAPSYKLGARMEQFSTMFGGPGASKKTKLVNKYGQKPKLDVKNRGRPSPSASPSPKKGFKNPGMPPDSPETQSSTKKSLKNPSLGGSFSKTSIEDSPILTPNLSQHTDIPGLSLNSPSPEPNKYDFPTTQFVPFKDAFADEDMDFLSEAQTLADQERTRLLMSSRRGNNEGGDSYSGLRCPMCNKPVDVSDLKEFGEMNTRKQERFCRSHQKKTAKESWTEKGYPEIDWDTLDSRISKHHKFIRRLINGGSCHYRDVLEETVKAGKDRNLLVATTSLTPGYYGPRGLRIISENIMEKFTPILKKRAPQDKLIAARGPTSFVQSVIVPEIATLLVTEDLDVGEEEARGILKDSADIGDLVNEEIREVVVRRLENSEDEEDELC